MSHFLVIVPKSPRNNVASVAFARALDLAHHLKRSELAGVVETNWGYAATFRRQNGSGIPPITSRETGSWLVAGGTWFHTEGFCSGDESRLLDRYYAIGADRLASELEGFFVIVIGDVRTREIVVITDLIGSHHCFVRCLEEITAISASSMLLASLAPYQLDFHGCREFLETGIIYEDRTFYQDVRKLGPGAVYRIVGGELLPPKRYWTISDIGTESLDGDCAMRTLWNKLTDVAQRIGRAYGNPVCDLTGGFDSRCVVAAFENAGVKFSTTVSGAMDSGDVRVAKKIAKLLNLPHVHLVPDAGPEEVHQALGVTDGEYNILEYASIVWIHTTLMRWFDVSINGSFGEVARGYWWELLYPDAGRRKQLDASLVARRRFATQNLEKSIFADLRGFDLVTHMADVIARTNVDIKNQPNTTQMDNAYLIMRMQRWQGRIASSTDQLWPCLSPFMCRSVLESMLRVNPQFRRRGLLIRSMLAAYAPNLARLPLEHGYPAVPVSWRTFHRFWPVPVYYGKKVLARVGIWPAGNPRSDQQPSLRLRLWKEDEIWDTLQFRSMKSGQFYEERPFQRFVESSRHEAFSFNDQWARILSLELTLKRIDKAVGDLSCSK